MVTAL